MNENVITRNALDEVGRLLTDFPAIVLVGPRQVGKTTLAKEIAQNLSKESVYLDLELPSDLAKLQEPELFLTQHQDKCVIIDEVQRDKSLFPVIRALIDQHRVAARFILLGSASPELIRDSSESLAGRVAYYQLYPIQLKEFDHNNFQELWLKGGFPNALLTENNETSMLWRQNFIKSYLERDLPLLGLNANAVMLRRLWEILAHQNGQILNISAISKALGLSVPTVKHYIQFMEAAFLLQVVKPYFGNIKKRLTKAPKVYLLDTGILHALLNLKNIDAIFGHIAAGSSFENFIYNQMVAMVGQENIYFYRTADGTEMDFVIAKAGIPFISIEVKLSASPTITKSFTNAIQDLKTEHNFIVAPVLVGYPLKNNVQVISINELLDKILSLLK
ncbi:MAG: ATP-binding protein [Candidatus Paceibacterota bacterium]